MSFDFDFKIDDAGTDAEKISAISQALADVCVRLVAETLNDIQIDMGKINFMGNVVAVTAAELLSRNLIVHDQISKSSNKDLSEEFKNINNQINDTPQLARAFAEAHIRLRSEH